jgi:predicted small metal-binding protein
MTEGKEQSKKCAFDCRDVGHDCDWQCVADDEDQLYEEVKMHANIHHDIWNLSRDTIMENARELD